MRGRRFLRPKSKKPSKRTRDSVDESYFEVKEEIDQSHIASSVLNAINHLGNQRFMLPPFAEHFDRWLKDLQSILTEFETQIPQAVDEDLRKEITDNMSNIRGVLAKCTEVESSKSNESTKLHQQVAHCEIELSDLEHAYKNQVHVLRRQYEKSDQKLREEIDQLDRKRMQILRKKTNILRRIFRKQDTPLQGTRGALDSRRSTLRDSEQNLQIDLRKHRDEYNASRQKLLVKLKGFEQKISAFGEIGDDALEARQRVCQRILLAINGAMQRNLTSESPNSSPSVDEDT